MGTAAAPLLPMASERKLSVYEAALAEGGVERHTGTPSVISCAIHLASLPEKPQLEVLIREQLLGFDSLAGRPKNGRWVPVVPFEMEKHLFFTELPTENDFVPWIEECMLKPLVNKKDGPWWEVFAVSAHRGTKAMLFFRIEHVCADGIALTQVLARVATFLDGSPMPPCEYTKRQAPKTDFCSTACGAINAAGKYAVLPFGAFDSDLPIAS